MLLGKVGFTRNFHKGRGKRAAGNKEELRSVDKILRKRQKIDFMKKRRQERLRKKGKGKRSSFGGSKQGKKTFGVGSKKRTVGPVGRRKGRK